MQPNVAVVVDTLIWSRAETEFFEDGQGELERNAFLRGRKRE